MREVATYSSSDLCSVTKVTSCNTQVGGYAPSKVMATSRSVATPPSKVTVTPLETTLLSSPFMLVEDATQQQ